jgi:hypothetical protein
MILKLSRPLGATGKAGVANATGRGNWTAAPSRSDRRGIIGNVGIEPFYLHEDASVDGRRCR